MLFQFPPLIQAGIEAGKFAPVFSNGTPLGIARDVATGRFIGPAVGVINNGASLSPLTVPVNLAMGGFQIYQMNQGFQSLQASISVLQTTTAIIGVGVAATTILSAVNLYQTLKLRKAVEQLDIKVDQGFLDIRQALDAQGEEIITAVERAIYDINFEQHRVVLVRAYGLFTQAINRLASAVKIQDLVRRNAEIDAVRGMLYQAHADYANHQLMEEVSAPAKLRRFECAWIIEQTIIATYQLQEEFVVSGHRTEALQSEIKHNLVNVIDASESIEDLEFIFPEIVRINNHDLLLLENWKNSLNWLETLPESELKQLQSADFSAQMEQTKNTSIISFKKPVEQLFYDDFLSKSHPYALDTYLRILINKSIKREIQDYIIQQAEAMKYYSLNVKNLSLSSEVSLANMFWYFRSREVEEKTTD
ncbi:hypothetical protein [Synechocystis salina]|uniref:Uncharacterized protein n=1 Tax=Synechocystis salina LEGE 00031 TaxID=1828736 RepID=A0ABR9VMY6_9SYNC|nr:hypothetical protein [Synechocystis salina]MBE9239658.1 hypothetical protein [Synechocystis salina LEGE 00041]MBE9252697.1 hypothetical protein [Synechocystis salina LEGE 00031]